MNYLRISHGARCSSSDNGAWLGMWQNLHVMMTGSENQIYTLYFTHTNLVFFWKILCNVCYSFLLNVTGLVHFKPRQSYWGPNSEEQKSTPFK